MCSDHCASRKQPTISAAHELNFQTELTIKPQTCWNTVWPPVEKPQRQEPRGNPCTKRSVNPEVRGCYKQFTEAKRLEWQSWIDNEVFDLVDMRKFKPKNYVTRGWVLAIKTDKQGNFLRAKARWVLRGFQDKQKDYLQTDSPASTRPGLRMNFHMAASKNWDLFHMDLKTATLSRQSYDVNRDVVCQLPPEASHPPCCCKTEETCMWHERCSQTLVEHSGQGTAYLWHGSHTSRSMLLRTIFSAVA